MSKQPLPYQRCYCSICRKAGGGGGFLINLSGDAATLKVEGSDSVKLFRARVSRDGVEVASEHRRHFCGECGAHLYASHERWPELVHPVAGAIDTPLPSPPSLSHMMVASKAAWVPLEIGAGDIRSDEYPAQSIAEWHDQHGVTAD